MSFTVDQHHLDSLSKMQIPSLLPSSSSRVWGTLGISILSEHLRRPPGPSEKCWPRAAPAGTASRPEGGASSR